LVVLLQTALKIAAVPVLKSPTFTLAFNLTLFISMHAASSPASSEKFAKSPNRIFGTVITEEVLGGSCGASYPSARAGDYFRIVFNGISQIYLVGDPISGAMMLLGVAAFSRVIAACLCAGTIIGAAPPSALCDLCGVVVWSAWVAFAAVVYPPHSPLFFEL
jgi:hypothetical protein